MAFLSLTLVFNTVTFFRDSQIAWAVAAGVFSLLYLLSTIGSYKNIKTLLWLAIICVSIYILYVIGAVIWALLAQQLTIFLVVFAVVFCLINIYVIYQLREQLSNMDRHNHGKTS